jgi:hypothetical protein
MCGKKVAWAQPQLGPGDASPRHNHSLGEKASSCLGSLALDRENVHPPCPRYFEKRHGCLVLGKKIRIISWGQKGANWHQSCHWEEMAKLWIPSSPPHGAGALLWASFKSQTAIHPRPVLYTANKMEPKERLGFENNCSKKSLFMSQRERREPR